MTKSKKATKRQPAKTTAPKPILVQSEEATQKEPVKSKLASAWSITKQTARIISQNPKIFIGLAAIYTVLNIIKIQSYSAASDIDEIKQSIDGDYPGGAGQLTTGLALFGYLVTATGSSSGDVAGAYQTIFAVIISLAVIWAVRQIMAGETSLRIRDAFYKGMYPLVPFVLVGFVILLQLLPLLIVTGIFNFVIGGLASSWIEVAVWALVLALGVGLSLYLIISSLLALYIVSLPDMTPLKALRSARDLVRGRRLTVLRKMLFLPLMLLILSVVIMLPVIWIATAIAPWVFFGISVVAVIVTHVYLYALYRELLT